MSDEPTTKRDVVPDIPDVGAVTDADLLITRAFDAPRDVIWTFFTDAQRLATWFGPTGTHVDPTSVDVDLRIGGRWDLDMVDDETDEHFPVRSTIVVVAPPEYLEVTMASGEGSGPQNELRLRLWFHDHGSKTRLTLHQGPFSGDFRERSAGGWQLSFTKVDAILEGESA